MLFRLTSEGRRALKGLVPLKGAFQAYVLGTDALGAWVLLPSKSGGDGSQVASLTLLKWNYVVTVGLEFRPQRPATRKAIGF